MVASASARSRFSNTVTVRSRLAFRATASFWATSFHTFQMGAPPQNCACVLSSAARRGLVPWPSSLTWVVRRLVGGGVRAGAGWRVHREQVRLGRVRDGDPRVILGCLQDGEATGGMHGRRLSPRRPQDGYQLMVPVGH